MNEEKIKVSITRKEFLSLPMETRRRILKEQAESLTESQIAQLQTPPGNVVNEVRQYLEWHTSETDRDLDKMAREIVSIAQLYEGDDSGIITKAVRESCVPTSEEVDEYLKAPDDPVASNLRESLSPDDFHRIAYVLLYGEKCLKAQQALTSRLKDEALVKQLWQAVYDARKDKEIDLPEELYEVFCAIQNGGAAKSGEEWQKKLEEVERDIKLELTQKIDDLIETTEPESLLERLSEWNSIIKSNLKGE